MDIETHEKEEKGDLQLKKRETKPRKKQKKYNLKIQVRNRNAPPRTGQAVDGGQLGRRR